MRSMMAAMLAGLYFSGALAVHSFVPKPHLAFFLTDDLGYNAPGFHNPDIISPHLDALHSEGVELMDHHVYRYCAPTRSSFLSGRLPYKLAATRKNFNPATVKDGLHLSYRTIGNTLQDAGYSTHQFGKWHAGFFVKEHTPLYRGFNSSYGFLTGGEDHYSEATICGAPVCGEHRKSIDIWDTDHPALTKNGTWSAQLFAEAAQAVIHAHDSSVPLFLYFALHNTHGPTQAPQRLIDLYEGHDDCRTVGNLSDCAIIHTFAAMITAVDETVFNVTTSLKEAGLWENTLLIWTTDNGAEITHQLPGCGALHPIPSISGVGGSPGYCGGGSNAPFRGGKGSNWEGGHRVSTFVSGPLLPPKMRGKKLDGLAAICDWYATVAALAGIDAVDPSPPAVAPLDSINLWPWISGEVEASPRLTLVHDHNYFCPGTNGSTVKCEKPWGAMRKGKWKLIVGSGVRGTVGQATWLGQFTPNATTPIPTFPVMLCPWDKPCLYDMELDKTEHHDVAETNPTVVKELMAMFEALDSEYHPPIQNPEEDVEGYCETVIAHQGFLGPWVH